MKKEMRGWMGVLLSASMVLSPTIQLMAANQYSVEMEDVGGKVLFPGDSVSGISPVYLGPDGIEQDVSSGSWTNNTDQAYVMSGMEGQDGLWLTPAGYVLTVSGGTSKVSGTEGTDTSNHYKAKDESEDYASDVKKDIAYYEAWSQVTVKADAPQEGKVFDHWEVVIANVSLADASAEETSFTMTDGAVSLNAVYVEASQTLEQETETQQAETELQTEAQQTEAPAETITEAQGETESQTGELETETENAADQLGELQTETSGDEGIVVIDGDDDQQNGQEAQYQLTVENGSGSGEYSLGTEVTVTADQIDGMVFTGWTTDAETVWFADAYSTQTTFSMPAEPVVVTATYESVPAETEAQTESQTDNFDEPETEIQTETPELYNATVENGEGSGTYEMGSVVSIMAHDAPEGQMFAGWSVPENVVLEDAQSQETSFVMPGGNVTVTAVYTQQETQPATEPDQETETEINYPDASDDETEIETETETETESETETETEFTDDETEIETETETEDEIVETETEEETDHDADQTDSYLITVSPDDVEITDGAELIDKGDGAGEQYYAEPGTTVSIKAPMYDDHLFDGWNVTSDTQGNIAVTTVSEDERTATFIMPSSPVKVQALYEEIFLYDAEIIDGSGSDSYYEGDVVEITANDAPKGYRFKGWTVVSGDVELDDASSETTTFTMPAEDVQIKAEYEVVKYSLVVNNGSGSGSYAMGEQVSLTANYPSSGKVFAGWKVTGGNAGVASADRYYSSITMPAEDVTVEATYKDGPSPDYNEIQNITAGGEYLKGETITFTAAGNGMDNTNPNPGDYRYRPTGYQIGTVTGNWNNAPYTTSMAINAVGQYTLTVNYAKDVFDGKTWNPDGSSVSKSVTFNVVNTRSVQTGDPTDTGYLLRMAAIAAAALIVIVVLVVVVIRRRRR